MTRWLTVRGAGQALCLPLDFMTAAQPDLSELSDLLAHYHGGENPPPLRRVPHYARYGLLAALRALREAGWNRDDARQTMLALGTAHSGTCMSMDFMDSLLDQGPRLSSPTAFSHAVNNMGAGLISLLLQVRGPCQTISQFGLSFAGALHAAALALHSGRARRALVGAVDETDPRFALHEQPCMQGGIFLCVEAAQEEAGLQICTLWGSDTAHKADLTLLSGDAATASQANPKTMPLAACLGRGPLEQALDVYLALRNSDFTVAHCLCADHAYGCAARVAVRRCS